LLSDGINFRAVVGSMGGGLMARAIDAQLDIYRAPELLPKHGGNPSTLQQVLHQPCNKLPERLQGNFYLWPSISIHN